jgi:inhibitor of cysteine peptidase
LTALAAVLLYAAGAGTHVAAAEAAKPMLQLSEADNDRTVDVHVGDTIRLTLPENATTGYRWAIDRHDDVVDVVADEPRYPAGAVGSGGEVAFTLKAKKSGSGELALKNWRQWEGDSSVTRRFRVRLNVQP